MKSFEEFMNEGNICLFENIFTTIFNTGNKIIHSGENSNNYVEFRFNNVKLVNPLTTGSADKTFSAKEIDLSKLDKYTTDIEFNTTNGKTINIKGIPFKAFSKYVGMQK